MKGTTRLLLCNDIRGEDANKIIAIDGDVIFFPLCMSALVLCCMIFRPSA